MLHCPCPASPPTPASPQSPSVARREDPPQNPPSCRQPRDGHTPHPDHPVPAGDAAARFRTHTPWLISRAVWPHWRAEAASGAPAADPPAVPASASLSRCAISGRMCGPVASPRSTAATTWSSLIALSCQPLPAKRCRFDSFCHNSARGSSMARACRQRSSQPVRSFSRTNAFSRSLRMASP